MDYDQTPLKNSTEFTYPAFKAFFVFSLFKGKHHRLKKGLFLFGYPILILLLTLDLFYFGLDTMMLAFDIALLVLYVLMLALVGYFPKGKYKQFLKIFSSGQHFAFRNEEFHVSQANDNFAGESTVKYETLHRLYETRSMFYLFLTSNQAYLVDKNGFPAGGADELRAMLKPRLGKKYVLCR